jgi:hypothetical protein
MIALRKAWIVLTAGLLAVTLTLASVNTSNARSHQPGPHDGHRVEQLDAQGKQADQNCPQRCQLSQYLVASAASIGTMRQVAKLISPLVSDPRAGSWLSLVETGPPKV